MRLVIYGMFCIGLAGLHVHNEFDKRVNFQPIDARVSAVDDQCYMEKSEGLVSGKSWTSDLLPCELAVLMTREHPKWQGYDVKHKIEVRFDYISPVDGATHASSLQMSAYPGDRPCLWVTFFPSRPPGIRQTRRAQTIGWTGGSGAMHRGMTASSRELIFSLPGAGGRAYDFPITPRK